MQYLTACSLLDLRSCHGIFVIKAKKAFINIVCQVMGRPFYVLVAQTPELFCHWHSNFPVWAHKMFFVFSLLCRITVPFVFCMSVPSFPQHVVPVP